MGLLRAYLKLADYPLNFLEGMFEFELGKIRANFEFCSNKLRADFEELQKMENELSAANHFCKQEIAHWSANYHSNP